MRPSQASDGRGPGNTTSTNCRRCSKPVNPVVKMTNATPSTRDPIVKLA